jgi:3-methylfumaryl-CoA hydratase
VTAIDIDDLKGWIGRTEVVRDTVTPRLMALFRATLDPHLAPAGEDAPLGIHWCLAPPEVPTGLLGPDGHPARGEFLPPIPLPRRMWAGGTIEHLAAIRVGDEVERRSVIARLRAAEGRSGPLCFVEVEHSYSTQRGLAIRERQDIVYREAQASGAVPAKVADDEAASGADLAWRVEATPLLLFRYSALTFNSHRIHYDSPYATEIEGYPGLVVHGPLQSTLLLNLAAALRGEPPHRFRYRGLAPLFAGHAVHLRAARTEDRVQCWSASDNGLIGTKAEAEW